jgi:phosphatidylglycerol:prolipoprotein diacylglycerol transferase
MISPWYDSSVKNPIIIFGTIPLFIFSVLTSIGVGLGLFWSVWPVSIFTKTAKERVDLCAIALGGALLGGRISYVLVNLPYFQGHIVEIPQVWLGGLSWAGSLSGALLVIFISARIRETPFGNYSDGLLPLLSSIAVSAWLACWVTGYAYGQEVRAWWGIPARDEWGIIATRWPTQLVGAISALGVQWITDQLRIHKWVTIPGFSTCLVISGLSVTNLVISIYRADPVPVLNGIRLDTWSSGGFLLFSIILALFYIGRLTKNSNMLQRSNHHEN